MNCTIVGEKLSHSPAAMGKADVLNTLDFVELLECTELEKDVLGIVGRKQSITAKILLLIIYHEEKLNDGVRYFFDEIVCS